MEDTKLEESLDFVDAIDFANDLHPYEEGVWNGVKNLAKNGLNNAKNAVANAGKNIANNVVNAGNNVYQTVNAKVQNAANNAKNAGDKAANIQQQKVLDQQVQALANKISSLLTSNASGELDKAGEKAAASNKALEKAKLDKEAAQNEAHNDAIGEDGSGNKN